MCPISKPEYLFGFNNLLSKKTAPPTPVPIIKKIESSYCFKEPYSFSAIAAHLASFCKNIGNLKSFFKISTISKFAIPKLSAFTTTPFETVPGKAIPILSIS